MHTWHFCNGGDNDDDNTSDDNHYGDNNGRVQVFLRTEFGQLVIQMFMGLLYRVLTMRSKHYNYQQPGEYDSYSQLHNYDDNQQHGEYDGHSNLSDISISHSSDNNGNKRPTRFHDSVAAGLQVLVFRQCKTLDEEVQLGQVRWLPSMWATRSKTACVHNRASERCHFCIGPFFPTKTCKKN